MLGAPTTPLFSITDFISFEVNSSAGPRYVGDILKDYHVIRIFGAAEHSAVGDAGGRPLLLMSIVTRAPCAEVLDFEVDGQVFVIHRCSPICENIFDYARNQRRARRPSADATAPAMQNFSLRLELCQPMTPALPMGKRRLRHVVVFAGSSQASNRLA